MHRRRTSDSIHTTNISIKVVFYPNTQLNSILCIPGDSTKKSRHDRYRYVIASLTYIGHSVDNCDFVCYACFKEKFFINDAVLIITNIVLILNITPYYISGLIKFNAFILISIKYRQIRTSSFVFTFSLYLYNTHFTE